MRRFALPLLFLSLLTACGESTDAVADEPVTPVASEGPTEEPEVCLTLVYATDAASRTFYYQRITPCLDEGAINQPEAADLREPFQEAVAKKAGLKSPAAVEVLDMKYDNAAEAEELVALYRDVKAFQVVELKP